ncbi:MAG: hypothetical protein ACRDLL_07415, partial [Solirubrobacterales bacterium]
MRLLVHVEGSSKVKSYEAEESVTVAEMIKTLDCADGEYRVWRVDDDEHLEADTSLGADFGELAVARKAKVEVTVRFNQDEVERRWGPQRKV